MTIEQIRNLPEDNWLGIKRIGEHTWQIGDQKGTGNSIMLVTGDGGVVKYVKTLLEEMRKPIPPGVGLLEQINEGVPSAYDLKDLTYEKLEKIVKEVFNGMDSKEE